MTRRETSLVHLFYVRNIPGRHNQTSPISVIGVYFRTFYIFYYVCSLITFFTIRSSPVSPLVSINGSEISVVFGKFFICLNFFNKFFYTGIPFFASGLRNFNFISN